MLTSLALVNVVDGSDAVFPEKGRWAAVEEAHELDQEVRSFPDPHTAEVILRKYHEAKRICAQPHHIGLKR